MPETTQFIKDAVKGGWVNTAPIWYYMETKKLIVPDRASSRIVDLHVILLNPQAWQAVSVTRGWHEDLADDWDEKDTIRMKMTDFVFALVDKKTIEEALTAIK